MKVKTVSDPPTWWTDFDRPQLRCLPAADLGKPLEVSGSLAGAAYPTVYTSPIQGNLKQFRMGRNRSKRQEVEMESKKIRVLYIFKSLAFHKIFHHNWALRKIFLKKKKLFPETLIHILPVSFISLNKIFPSCPSASL